MINYPKPLDNAYNRTNLADVLDNIILDVNKHTGLLNDAAKCPTGSMLMYGASAAPTDWLLCDGASYLRTDYAALFAAIGTSFGAADSTHFNVPDMKDAFPRGTGTSTIFTDNTKGTRSASKTGGASSGIGSKQEDSSQGHNTTIVDPQHTHALSPLAFYGAAGGSGDAYAYGTHVGGVSISADSTGITATTPITDGANGTPRTGPETRPKNIELNFIIKT